MNYLLDTNAVIAILNDSPANVRKRLKKVAGRGGSVAVSTIALFELWCGVARSARRRENAERLRIFLSGVIGVVPVDEEDAEIAGGVRSTLESRGKPMGPLDILIAAQALRLGAILVTANVSEFSQVPDLSWQDWS
jgi:tRNA(fMet)-specific endonuclease VapC